MKGKEEKEEEEEEEEDDDDDDDDGEDDKGGGEFDFKIFANFDLKKEGFKEDLINEFFWPIFDYRHQWHQADTPYWTLYLFYV